MLPTVHTTVKHEAIDWRSDGAISKVYFRQLQICLAPFDCRCFIIDFGTCHAELRLGDLGGIASGFRFPFEFPFR